MMSLKIDSYAGSVMAPSSSLSMARMASRFERLLFRPTSIESPYGFLGPPPSKAKWQTPQWPALLGRLSIWVFSATG